MRNTQKRRPLTLGRAEQTVLDHLWAAGPSTSEACREAVAKTWPMKESTLRTVLRRLERKGYVAHRTEGRAFVYYALQAREGVAARAVRHIIDRFCGGSAEALVLGLVEHDVLTPVQVQRIAKAIEARKRQKG